MKVLLTLLVVMLFFFLWIFYQGKDPLLDLRTYVDQIRLMEFPGENVQAFCKTDANKITMCSNGTLFALRDGHGVLRVAILSADRHQLGRSGYLYSDNLNEVLSDFAMFDFMEWTSAKPIEPHWLAVASNG
ncbi:MAG: hypothetical protein KDD62_01450 [Bdellovibrionales bacterium]|nr:hypothetical protein [Bdellovibrionales bacterium]